MARWHGHTATTSAYVLSILTKAQAGGTCFSHAERVLCTACEFWAAAMNNTLAHHLGSNGETVLREAEESFTVIGVGSVVTILRGARSHLSTSMPNVPVRRVAAILQKALDCLEEPVDDLIGRFAAEQTWAILQGTKFSASAARPKPREP